MNKDMLFRRIYAYKWVMRYAESEIENMLLDFNIPESKHGEYYGCFDDKPCPKGATKEEKEKFKMLQYDYKKCNFCHTCLYWDILSDNHLGEEYTEYHRSGKGQEVFKQNKDYKLTDTWIADCLEEKESE